MKFDLHTHHYRCAHAPGQIRDYIEAAIDKGLHAIGISDHAPYFCDEADHAQPAIAMAKSEFPHYINEVLALKKQYEPRIEVLLGVESVYFPEHIDYYKTIYSQYPLDYIIGSVHHSNGTSIFDRNRWSNLTAAEIVAEKEQYFNLIKQSFLSGAFDILGHIDALAGFFPQLHEYATPAVDDTLRVIGEHAGVIEVNTSGKNKLCGGWHPADELLERAHYFGVQVTFGSDAHVTDRVGDEWDEVSARLKQIGFTKWTLFQQRQRCEYAL